MKLIYRTALLAATAMAAQAAIVYSNTTNDLVQSILYADGGWEELGDQITLDGTARALNSASLQLYNRGAAGTFDATLRFYLPGAPVGADLGAFTLTGLNALDATGPEFGVFTIDFALGGLIVPDEVIFTLQVSALGAGVDLGLNLFNPPTAGSSDDGFHIAREHSFGAVTGPPGNFYLELDASDAGATAVPEPASFGLCAAAAAGLLIAVRRGQSSR
ncbi:MAG: hypothetical protein IT162_19895 [Bryobacterales bacterium]|nr:hypothetical protein [Bryobacterales bacterium]